MPVDLERARLLARELLEVLYMDTDAQVESITLTGTIGRPSYSQVKGTSLFTAGLGVRRIDGKLEWVNLEAWRDTADAMKDIARGKTATVIGKWKTNQWVDQNGVMRSRDVFVVNDVEE